MVRLSVIGQLVRRRWRLLVVLAAVGALLGAGASLLFSPGYASTGSVLLQGAQGEEDLATQAQIAMSSVVLDRTAAGLGPGVTGAGLRNSVRVEVLDGNVITISGSAESPERAQQLTRRLTREYIDFSEQLVNGAAAAADRVLQQRRATLEQRVVETNRRITELQESVGDDARPGELERLQTTLADALTELDRMEGRGLEADAGAAFARASIVVMEPAALPTTRADPTPAQFVAGGALLLFLLGVVGNLVAARADRRLWDDAEISAALGSPVVGAADVPDGPEARQRPAGSRRWQAWLWRLVRDDRLWDAPPLGDALSREVRYRRVLARLRGGPGTVLRLLVLVADDDSAAQRAAGQLAVAAGADGEPASVLTDSAEVSRIVQAASAGTGTGSGRLTLQPRSVPASGGHRTVLRIVELSAARPTIPDCGPLSGALLVLTAGTRTPWELVGITEACADAGYRVVGAFVTRRARPTGGLAVEPASPEVSLNGRAKAGSA